MCYEFDEMSRKRAPPRKRAEKAGRRPQRQALRAREPAAPAVKPGTRSGLKSSRSKRPVVRSRRGVFVVSEPRRWRGSR